MFNIIAVALGIAIFIYSVTLFWRIYSVSRARGLTVFWFMLALLVFFFLLGYIGFEVFLITGREIVGFKFLVSQVFFWGSVFVLITAYVFYLTTVEQKKIIDQALLDLRKRDEEEKSRMKFMIDELQKANDKLKKMDKTKDEFLSIVTHDLKTPLVSIYGYTGVLQDGLAGEVTEKQQSILAIIKRQSKALEEMIDSILDFTRMEFAKITLNREQFSINSLIAALMEEIKPCADQKKISLDMKLPGEDIVCYFDKRMINRVVTNLISNAIKYTPEEGKMAVSLDKDGNLVRISVKDDGIGIKKDYLPQIFGKFFMVDKVKAGEKKSLGLGLHIAKSFIEAHRGKIWAESEGEGKGTKFIVELPLT